MELADSTKQFKVKKSRDKVADHILKDDPRTIRQNFSSNENKPRQRELHAIEEVDPNLIREIPMEGQEAPFVTQKTQPLGGGIGGPMMRSMQLQVKENDEIDPRQLRNMAEQQSLSSKNLNDPLNQHSLTPNPSTPMKSPNSLPRQVLSRLPGMSYEAASPMRPAPREIQNSVSKRPRQVQRSSYALKNKPISVVQDQDVQTRFSRSPIQDTPLRSSNISFSSTNESVLRSSNLRYKKTEIRNIHPEIAKNKSPDDPEVNINLVSLVPELQVLENYLKMGSLSMSLESVEDYLASNDLKYGYQRRAKKPQKTKTEAQKIKVNKMIYEKETDSLFLKFHRGEVDSSTL